MELARPFCRETLETQDLKIVIYRKTLETQDLKTWICGETLETQNPEPQNFDVSRLESPWTLHHSIQIFMLSIVPGSSTGDELERSEFKNLNF